MRILFALAESLKLGQLPVAAKFLVQYGVVVGNVVV